MDHLLENLLRVWILPIAFWIVGQFFVDFLRGLHPERTLSSSFMFGFYAYLGITALSLFTVGILNGYDLWFPFGAAIIIFGIVAFFCWLHRRFERTRNPAYVFFHPDNQDRIIIIAIFFSAASWYEFYNWLLKFLALANQG